MAAGRLANPGAAALGPGRTAPTAPRADSGAPSGGGFLAGASTWCVKAASAFYDNPGRGLPIATGASLALSAETGFLRALLLDNGYLTELRTGAAGALAADLLAP